jgi:hypothetical protein
MDSMSSPVSKDYDNTLLFIEILLRLLWYLQEDVRWLVFDSDDTTLSFTGIRTRLPQYLNSKTSRFDV